MPYRHSKHEWQGAQTLLRFHDCLPPNSAAPSAGLSSSTWDVDLQRVEEAITDYADAICLDPDAGLAIRGLVN